MRIVTIEFIIQKHVLDAELTDLSYVTFSDFADNWFCRNFLWFYA